MNSNTVASQKTSADRIFKSGKPFSIIEIPSELMPDQTIVLIAKYNQTNRKTGLMVQLSILDTSIQAVHKIDGSIPNGQGCSESQCTAFKACYVRSNIQHIFPMTGVLNRYKAGELPSIHWIDFVVLCQDKNVRFGEFGDPAAINIRYVEELAYRAKNHTGYTHQWKTCNQDLRFFFMASVETQADYDQAVSMGWKCFFVGADPIKGKIMQCPNESKANLQCQDCMLCNGAKTKFSISIQPHGRQGKHINPLRVLS